MTAWQSSMENRLGSFDRRLEDLRKVIDRDFRWTWGGMVAFAAAAVAGYFALADKMNSQFLTLLDKIN